MIRSRSHSAGGGVDTLAAAAKKLLLGLCATCATLALPAATMTLAGDLTVRSADGHTVKVADSSRIVSVGGAVTEILYALGREDHIVAVDSTSTYPPPEQKKPNVGYMRQLSAEGVLGLNPSLVLASEDSGPKETLAVLTEAKVPLVLVPERYSGDGVIEKIGVIAQAVDAPIRGRCLAAAVGRDLEALARVRHRIDKPLKVMFVLSLMNGRPMASGIDTAANGVITLAGGINAISDYSGYRLINDEAVIAAAPDVVLVMQRSGESISADEVFGLSAFSLTPAARRRAFVSMDGLYLLGFGPRTPQAAHDLAAAIYPDIVKQATPGVQDPQRDAENCR